MKTYKTPKIIAHRGASNEAPENTLSAIQKAMEIGVDGIEFDVRLTRDNIPVVIHDSTVLRTTGGIIALHVHELNLDQIKELDVGKWFDSRFAGETIPTLEEILQLTSNQTDIMIEIKQGIQSPQLIVDRVLKATKSAGSNLEILKFGSFSIEIIQELLKINPLINVIGIIEKPDKIKTFLDNKMKHIALWHELITQRLIHELHFDHITVWTFTVDDVEKAHLLADLSIEGIITNQPRTMQKLIEKHL